MVWFGNQDPAKSLNRGFGPVVELQHVVVLEVERQRSDRAVEFDPQRILAAQCEPGGFEGAESTTVEAGEKRSRVIDSDRTPRYVLADGAVAT
jgi:hypothetical protein